MSYIRRATRNSTPLLPSHDKHESRKSRDGERFRSAAGASFQLDGVSRSVTAAGSVSSRSTFQRTLHATSLDSLMERCPSNCARVIFCNRKQFHSATRVSTAAEICLPLQSPWSAPGSSPSPLPHTFFFQKYAVRPLLSARINLYHLFQYNHVRFELK